jgi:dihydroflavonol-4-reductase
MRKTAFVTGSTGFLGLNLIEELLKRRWEVVALHLPSDNLHYLSRYNVTPVGGNITDYNSLINVMPVQADAVFHVAGITSMWSKHNKVQYRVNVLGTRNIVNASLEKKAKKFIFTSSISAYGYHKTLIDENTKSNALHCKMNYNITKYMAEQIIKEAIQKGLHAVMLNPCNIIGPYDINGWASLIKTVYHGKLFGIPPGRAMFCHVKDIVDAHINAVDKGVDGDNYLLGGAETSFKDVFNEIEKLLGKKISTSIQPKWKIKLASYIFSLKSKIDGKEPLVTYEKYKRLVGRVACNYDKAIRTLDYHTSSISQMINDSYSWLKKENLL